MKRITTQLLIGLVIVLGLAGVAQAVEPKVSYFYEASDSQFIKLIGTSVKEDIADIKGLDIDIWYKLSRPSTEIKYDEIELNNLVMPGVSYSIDIKGWDLGFNAACGLDRIESIIDSSDIGEFKYGIGIVVGKKI